MRNRWSRFYNKLTCHDRSHVGFHANCRFTLKYGIALYIKLKNSNKCSKTGLDSGFYGVAVVKHSLISYKNPQIVHWGARVLIFSNYEADSPQLLKKLNWDNIETRRQILKAEMVYKSLNGLSPDCKFIPRSDINNRYDLWNSANKLAVPLPRTNCYKNSFSYGGAAVPWKRLPSNVRRQPR